MASMESDKLRIASHFMLASPPAQITEVEKDVRVLLGSTALGEAAAREIHASYAASHCVPIKIASSGGVMLATPEGRVDSDRFVDSGATPPCVRVVDSKSCTVVETSEVQDASARFESTLEAHRVALRVALQSHATGAYNVLGSGSTPWARGVEVFSTAGDASRLTALASVTVRNMANFWSGSWLVRVLVAFPEGVHSGKASVSGTVAVVTHYFEAANAQMHDDKAFGPVSVSFSDADSFARAVVKAVADAEDALHAALGEMYDSMSSQALKEMRRFLPVNGQKFNWNVAEHRMRRTLTTSSGAAAAAAK